VLVQSLDVDRLIHALAYAMPSFLLSQFHVHLPFPVSSLLNLIWIPFPSPNKPAADMYLAPKNGF